MRGLLHRLLHWLAALLEPSPAAGEKLTARITFEQGGIRSMGEITVNEGDPPISATVSYVNAQGAAAEASDTPVWSSADDAIASVEASSDGLSATVTPLSSGDAEGGTAVVISCVAHDREGDEVRSEGTVTVQPGGEVLIGEITFSEESADGGPGIGGGIGDAGPSQAPEGDEPQVNPLR
jgi:hypothetical protein